MKKTDKTAETMSYAKMGMAAVLPGMVHMLELMQAEVDRFRQQLAAMQDGEVTRQWQADEETPPQKLASGWPADPEERSAEMKRRRAVQKQNKRKAALAEARREAWHAQPAKVRKARLAAMAAGKAKKQPVVKLEQVA